MNLGQDRQLYMLAFDHRASFSRDLLGIEGTPTRFEAERITDAKLVIYEAFLEALDSGVEVPTAGLLVDEEFGADVARPARTAGFTLAMPVEKSGQKTFDFEFGDDFARHIELFDPSFVKVLVRYNPEGDRPANRMQRERLKRLSDWLHENDRKFLFELLVPAEPYLLAWAGGERAYDRSLRPRLVVEAIEELQRAGIEPDIWKIEGLERREDCVRVANQARMGGRAGVACIVLGRGADVVKVRHWLEIAADVPGFTGFAVGRTIWWTPLKRYVAGVYSRDRAIEEIATTYRGLVDTYRAAAGLRGSDGLHRAA